MSCALRMLHHVRTASRTITMSASQPMRPLVVVVGATGTGKSRLAVDLARRFKGEVVNCDIMQMYEGLPIITNKITPREREGVPHHLLGCISLRAPPWTVGDFVHRAKAVINGIHERGALPVLVGGTHYYLQSLLFQSIVTESKGDVHSTEMAWDEDSKWTILDASPADMMAELKKVDPIMASRWHPNDRRKIRRSLEIFLQTGRKASDIYADQRDLGDSALQNVSVNGGHRHGHLVYPTLMLWTHSSRETLSQRLDMRVDAMLDSGLIDEVVELNRTRSDLEADNISIDPTHGIWVSIGYKEFLDYTNAVQAGQSSDITLEQLKREAIERTQINTRKYAKSQIKWIRIKMANALRDGGAKDALYLIQTDRTDWWQDDVLRPSEALVQNFLDGRSLPMPETMSETAKDMLTLDQDFDLSRRPDLWVSQVCELCDVSATTERDWEKHVNGRKHKAAERRQRREAVRQTESG